MNVTTKRELNLKVKTSPPLIDAMQYDTDTRSIEFSLFSGSDPWPVPIDVSVAVGYKTKENTMGFYDKLSNGLPAIKVIDNTITVILAQEMLTVPGRVEACLILSNENLDQLKTFPFYIRVTESPITNRSKCNSPSPENYIRLEWLENRLKELKESGVFDGKNGATGPQGPQGIPGPEGSAGPQGKQGIPGQSPYIGDNGNWFVWDGDQYQDTGVSTDIPAEVRTLNSNLTATQAELKAQKIQNQVQRYELENLKAAANGQLYREHVDSAEGYSKTIPSGAMPYASFDRLGGCTEAIDGELVSAKVSNVLSNSVEGTVDIYLIPEAIRNLPGYGWSAGNVYNEVDFEKKQYIQRIGSLDLGTLAWSYSGITFRTSKYPSDMLSASGIPNLLTAPYNTVETRSAAYWNNYPDKSIGFRTDELLMIRNDEYTDATAFKTAMSGVMLYYELVEPIITDISNLLEDHIIFINVAESGTLTFEQSNGTQLPVPSQETYLIKTTGGISA